MTGKAARIERRQQQLQEKLQRKQAKLENAGKFARWRNSRPFWGATLILLAGLAVLYIPIQLYAIAFIPGSLVFVGFLFGGLMVLIGALAYIYPQFSTVFGVITIFLSVLSIMGALGGFIIGTILGIIGGALCVGWTMVAVPHDQDRASQKQDKKDTIKANEGTTASV